MDVRPSFVTEMARMGKRLILEEFVDVLAVKLLSVAPCEVLFLPRIAISAPPLYVFFSGPGAIVPVPVHTVEKSRKRISDSSPDRENWHG